jgi:hypothetical protein
MKSNFTHGLVCLDGHKIHFWSSKICISCNCKYVVIVIFFGRTYLLSIDFAYIKFVRHKLKSYTHCWHFSNCSL